MSTKNPYKDKVYLTHRGLLFWAYDYKCFTPACKKACTDLHHLDHCNTNNDLNNLIPVCNSCHKFYDKKVIKSDAILKSHYRMLQIRMIDIELIINHVPLKESYR